MIIIAKIMEMLWRNWKSVSTINVVIEKEKQNENVDLLIEFKNLITVKLVEGSINIS